MMRALLALALVAPALSPSAPLLSPSAPLLSGRAPLLSSRAPARDLLLLQPARITFLPARPKQGTLFRIRVANVPAGASLAGHAGGEPLHFESGADSTERVALAAVPIDSAGTLGVLVTVTAGGLTDTLRTPVAVAPGDYPREELRVAPRYGRPPSRALSERIARESRQALEVSRAAHETPRLWTGEPVRPRPGRITSGYGRARTFNGTVASRHMGTDFAGAPGAPIRAIARGVVRIVDDFYYGGNVVYLDHGAGLTSAYLHMSRTDVAAGDTVDAGALIGRVGATGRVTGPHLHLIVRYGAVTVDPMSFLARTP